MKNFWTRLASTHGCMMIILTRKTLVIKPHRFAGWFINPLRLDLTHEIPVANIAGVTLIDEHPRYGKVEVRFRTVDGENRSILLYLKRYREFMNRIAAVTGR